MPDGREPGSGGPGEAWFEASFNASLVNVRVINGAIAGALAEIGLSDEVRHDVTLGVAELVTNIARHEYRGDGAREILCRISYGPAGVAVMLRSDGDPFNPFDRPDVEPDDAEPEPGEAGGLGIFIVRSVFDESRWRYHGGRNELVLVRRSRSDGERGGSTASSAA